MRRTSEYFRSRSSTAVVEETRGVPFKLLSLLLGVVFVVPSIRNFFFCKCGFTEFDAQSLAEWYPDCDSDRFHRLSADMSGMCGLFFALIRFHVATTTHVADLYLSMKALVFMDTVALWILIRLGLQETPSLLYPSMVLASLIYEVYIFMVARKAYIARSKTQKRAKGS